MPDAECRPEAADSPPSVSKEPLWTADLVLASIINFVLIFVFYALMATMAVYAMVQFAVSDSAGGLAASVFIVGSTVTRLFAGNLVDLVGKRRVLITGMVLFGVMTATYFFVTDSFAVLIAVRALHGAAFAMSSTAALALAQTVIPRSRFAEGTSYFTLSIALATGAGPFVALHVVNGNNYDLLFAVALSVAMLGFVLALFLRTPETPLDPEYRARLRRFRPKDLLHPAVLPVSTFVLIIGVAYSGVLTYLESYGAERDLESGVAVFFLVYAASMLVARLIVGRVQDVHGDNIVVYTAVIVHALGLVTLSVASSAATLLLAAGLIGAGFGTQMSALQVVSVKKVPPQRLGVAISTYFFMLDIGVGLGPIFLGLLLGVLPLDVMYAALAAVMVLSTGIYYLVHGREFGGRPA